MNLLVTGGCGFIGAHFIRHMFEHYPGLHITNIDNLSYAGSKQNLGAQLDNPNYRFYEEDICNVANLEFGKEFDWIINFAAQTHVDRSIDNASPFLKTNILGTHALLEFARKRGVKFFQIGTDEAYGDVLDGTSKEDSPLRPSSPYAVSKVAADLLVLSYHRTYKLPFIITRSANNYGPQQYPEKLIPLFIRKLIKGEKVGLYGDGKQVREWIWVEDHVRAIDHLIQLYSSLPIMNEIYNIGTGELHTNLEVTRKIIRHLGDGRYPPSSSSSIFQKRPIIRFIPDRKGHDRRYAINSQKIRKLGWSPLVAFNEGLPRTIEWYESHQGWWPEGESK